MNNDEERLQRISRKPNRAEPTGTSADFIRLDVPCRHGHVSKIELAELAANNMTECAYCGDVIDITTPEWQAKIDEATQIHIQIKPYR